MSAQDDVLAVLSRGPHAQGALERALSGARHPDTVRAARKTLVSSGVIIVSGQGKATVYRLKDPGCSPPVAPPVTPPMDAPGRATSRSTEAPTANEEKTSSGSEPRTPGAPPATPPVWTPGGPERALEIIADLSARLEESRDVERALRREVEQLRGRFRNVATPVSLVKTGGSHGLRHESSSERASGGGASLSLDSGERDVEPARASSPGIAPGRSVASGSALVPDRLRDVKPASVTLEEERCVQVRFREEVNAGRPLKNPARLRQLVVGDVRSDPEAKRLLLAQADAFDKRQEERAKEAVRLEAAARAARAPVDWSSCAGPLSPRTRQGVKT